MRYNLLALILLGLIACSRTPESTTTIITQPAAATPPSTVVVPQPSTAGAPTTVVVPPAQQPPSVARPRY